MQVDAHAVGEAHIVEDQIDEVGALAPAVQHLDRRNDEPLGMDVVAVGEVAARERAAGIHLMAAAQSEEQQLAVIKDRADIAPIGKVAIVAAVIGIVGQEDVAGVDVAGEIANQILDGERGAEELHRQAGRNGDGSAIGAPDADGQILQLADQVVLRRAFDDVAHLLADGLHRMPDGGDRRCVDIGLVHDLSS